MQNTPVELQEGATLRFAASSRDYILRHSPSAEESETMLAEQSKAVSVGNSKRRDDSLLASTPQDSQVAAVYDVALCRIVNGSQEQHERRLLTGLR